MLVSVDDVDVTMRPLDEITRRLCGSPGTPVTLQFRRAHPHPPHTRLVTAELYRGAAAVLPSLPSLPGA